MFDQILDLVKEKLGGTDIPPGRQHEVQREVAGKIKSGIGELAEQHGGIGDLLSSLAGSASPSPVVGAIAGGIASSLGSKFGLSPAVTGAIAGAIPGILEKFAHKAGDPNDHSISIDSIKESLGKGGGGLGSILKGI